MRSIYSILCVTTAMAAALSACQTIETVPEQTRLALIQQKPVDYGRFPKREAEDKQEGRGLRNSVSLAQEIGDFNLVEDRVIEEDLSERLTALLPKDYSYKMGDQTLSDYPLDTQFHIYDKEVFDAHALPNGDIVFSNAILNETTSADTLDWIVAHEAAHQLLDHHKSREDREARNQVISILGTIAIIATGDSRAGNIALAATQAALIANQIGVSQFELKEEIQADQLAMDLVLNKKVDPRNPTRGVEKLELFRDGLEGTVKEISAKVDAAERQYTNYCGEAGVFSPLTQAQNPNSQTQLCKQWYSVGRAGIEQYFKLPEAKLEFENMAKRVADSKRYFEVHIATLPGELPPVVDFKDKRTGQVTSYAESINKNGPSVRTYAVRRVDELLDEGRCKEAVLLSRRTLLGPSDADPSVRGAAFRAEKRCPTDAQPYQTVRTCKKSVGHFGPYEHLCISFEASRASESMMRELQSEYERRELYKDALNVLLVRRSKSGLPVSSWYPEEIRLQRLAGDLEKAKALYEECATLDKVDKDFKQLCRRSAYPEEFEIESAPPVLSALDDAALQLPPLVAIPVTATLPVSFDVFEEAVLRTELNNIIGGEGEFTIYMPSDNALRRYLDGQDPHTLLEPQNREALRRIISAHIVRTDKDGKSHHSSPHLSAGFATADDVESALFRVGGTVHGSATYGRITLKPVDTVIAPIAAN